MKIFRKRYVPNEIVDISGDEVIYRDSERLMTRWKPIKPREDFSRGESCVYFKHGWKVSKFFNKDGNLKYWYCDIIDFEYQEEDDKYIIIDLLLDVIVYEDGHYEVLDEQELEDALNAGIITKEIAEEAKQKLNKLLEFIKENRFKELEF